MKTIKFYVDPEILKMTGREFINNSPADVCDDGIRWMRCFDLDKPIRFFWNKCQRYGWLRYMLYCIDLNQFNKKCRCTLPEMGFESDAFGNCIDDDKAKRFRAIVKIERK